MLFTEYRINTFNWRRWSAVKCRKSLIFCIWHTFFIKFDRTWHCRFWLRFSPWRLWIRTYWSQWALMNLEILLYIWLVIFTGRRFNLKIIICFSKSWNIQVFASRKYSFLWMHLPNNEAIFAFFLEFTIIFWLS